MKHSGSVGRALVWYSHTAISDICFHALCHMGDINHAFKLSGVVLIMLTNVKMPFIVCVIPFAGLVNIYEQDFHAQLS